MSYHNSLSLSLSLSLSPPVSLNGEKFEHFRYWVIKLPSSVKLFLRSSEN